jgi:hypothetical protein
MRNRIPFYTAIVVIAAACSSKTLYRSYTAVAPESLPDSMYACVNKQLDSLGFKRNQYNVETRTVTSRRTSTTPRESNALARKWYDQLTVAITPELNGGTNMDVRASSFIETNTQRGPTTDETPVYKDALSAADSLIAACGAQKK